MAALPQTQRRSLTIAVLFLTALMPMTLAGPALAHGECQEITQAGHVTTSHPLREKLTASEVLVLFAAPMNSVLQQNAQLVNGVDAYVVDLGCGVHSATFSVTATGDPGCDPAVKFSSSQFTELDFVNDRSDTIEDGDVPEESRYAVIVLEDGPPVGGLTDAFPARPYSCKVLFEMAV